MPSHAQPRMSSSLTESSSRNRSGSVEGSELPKHEHKRPRLNLTETATSTTSGSTIKTISDDVTSNITSASTVTMQTPPDSPQQEKIPLASSTISPTSRVTINTRPLSSQSMNQRSSSGSAKEGSTSEQRGVQSPCSESPVMVTLSDGDLSKSNTGGENEPISISSSRSTSPVPIPTQPPQNSEGDARPVDDGASNEEPTGIEIGHLSRTIPYGHGFTRSEIIDAITDMCQHIEDGEAQDANIIRQFGSWFKEFAQKSSGIEFSTIKDECELWQLLPRIAIAFAKRRLDSPEGLEGDDLVAFVYWYARTAIRMLQIDVQRLRAYSDGKDAEPLPLPIFMPYLRQLNILCSSTGNFEFFRILRLSSRVESITVIRSIHNKLIECGAKELIETLAALHEQIIRLIPMNPKFCNIMSTLLQQSNLSVQLLVPASSATEDRVRELRPVFQNFVATVNRGLEQAIKKQQTWLSIENAHVTISNFGHLTTAVASVFPDMATQIFEMSRVDPNQFPVKLRVELLSWAYRFYMLLKFIQHGRMELRVLGIENLAAHLVTIWQSQNQSAYDGFIPAVRFAAAFLQGNDLVTYIVGVDSHPQIVQRSSNVIGFLAISRNWKATDTDIAWHAVLDSQDGRTSTAVLDVLKSVVVHFDTDSIQCFLEKLLALPFDRIDIRILNFAMVLLQQGVEHCRTRSASEAPLRLLLVKLCLRLLRDGNSPNISPSEVTEHIRFEIPRYLTNEHKKCSRNLLDGVSGMAKVEILSTLCDDIASHNAFATGSIIAMHFYLAALDRTDATDLVRDSDYTRLLIDDIAEISSHYTSKSEAVSEKAMWCAYEARITSLGSLLMQVPNAFDNSLATSFWNSVLISTLPVEIRSMAWNTLASTLSKSIYCNVFLETIITDLFPLLPANLFNRAVLLFAEMSVRYDMQHAPSELLDPDSVVEIPGMERVWRLMLEAAPGTIETEASEFIISKYLDSDTMNGRSRASIEATHAALIDRCVRTTIESATEVKAHAARSMSASTFMEHAPSEDELKTSRLHFSRSLLFLRKFLEVLKLRPQYRIVTNTNIQTILNTFQPRGQTLQLDLMVVSHPVVKNDKNVWTVGNENTASELYQFLSEVTGWNQFSFIKSGLRHNIQNQTTLVRDMKLGPGPVMVCKSILSEENTTTRTARASSPVDTKIMHHFDELYSLLDAEYYLAKEIYEFLILFSSQENIVQGIESMSLSPEELLPADRPFQLMYYTRALRSCIEDESFSMAPKAEFLQYTVHSILTSLGKIQTINTEPEIQTAIFHGITETLLLALRAKVSADISSSYIADHQAFATQLLNFWEHAHAAVDKGTTVQSPHTLICVAFETLIEATLHDNSLWQYFGQDERFLPLLNQSLLRNSHVEVSQGVLDVICRMTGAHFGKSLLKSSDPRSPKARFPAERINECLKNLWSAMYLMLPDATKYPAHCQHTFEAASTIFKAVGTSLGETVSKQLFETAKDLLLAHNHEQDVGQNVIDHVTWGLSILLHQCCLSLKTLGVSCPGNENFIADIFTRFLFPPLSSDDFSPFEVPKNLVIDSYTREALYDLVIVLLEGVSSTDIVLSELENDLVDEDAFPPNCYNERKSLRTEVGYSGLRNLSNTCYLNSLFTQLFMNLRFRDFILNAKIVDETKQKLIVQLANVFADMQSSYEKYISPEEAVDAIVPMDGDQIDVTVQMDVDEFFNLLFDRLESQIVDGQARETFRSMYGGQLVQQIKSKECEHVSERLEPFSAVQIEIKGKSGLEEGLTAYVEGEVLQGDNKYSCTSCGRHVDAVKRACLKDLPDNLIFNLKRFDYDIMTMLRCKVNDEFHFPENINMAPYTIDALSKPDEAIAPDKFELVGVIIHSGTAETGHYYSYIRERPSTLNKQSTWVQFNDQDVTKFDFSTMRDCAFGGVDYSFNNMPKFYNGYMLFYQRTSSIWQYAQNYPLAEKSGPIRLPLPEDISHRIVLENELCLRRYVAQDSTHARFIRQLLEKVYNQNQYCSVEHKLEDRTLKITLQYIQLISSRWKDAPEFEETVRQLIIKANNCYLCALSIVRWFATDDVAITCLARATYQFARKNFAILLSSCLSKLHEIRLQRSSEARLPELREMAVAVNNVLYRLVDRLYMSSDLMQRLHRAWDSFFGVLTNLTKLGPEEAGIVIKAGFFEKTLEFVWVHYQLPRLTRDLRLKYNLYLTAREKSRPFGHQHMVELFAALLPYIDLDVSPESVSTESLRKWAPSESELMLLGLNTDPPKFLWFKKLVWGRSNPNAVLDVVKELCKYPSLIEHVENILQEGLEDEHSLDNAVSFLEPSAAFIVTCPSASLAQNFARTALESIDTTRGVYASEFLSFVHSLVQHSDSINWAGETTLEKIVLQKVPYWVPVLVLAQTDVQSVPGNDTLRLINHILFAKLPDLQNNAPDVYEHHVRIVHNLVRACINYARKSFLQSSSRDRFGLQSGQLSQLENLIEKCKPYLNTDNADDLTLVEHIDNTLYDLSILVQNSDALEEECGDPSSDMDHGSDMESFETSP